MSLESLDGTNQKNKFEMSTNENFPGSLIVNDGREFFAIRKNEHDAYEGNSFTLLENGSVGPTYQMHESDFDHLREIGALDAFDAATVTENQSEQAFEELPNHEGTDIAYSGLLRIFNLGDRIDPFGTGRIEAAQADIDSTREALEKLSDAQQEFIAQKFFTALTLDNISAAYNTYGVLKGTAFAKKFKELESNRLEAAGYSAFTL